MNLIRITACLFVLLWPATATSYTKKNPENDLLQQKKQKLFKGDVLVRLQKLQHKVIAVKGEIFIAALPEYVWQSLTDYEKLDEFVPHMLESRIIKNKGAETTVFQKARTGVLFFNKTSQITLKVTEEFCDKIFFEQLKGDFVVYKGNWQLDYDKSYGGIFLSFHADIKPDFFAPQFITRYIQKRDLKQSLKAIKLRAEKFNNKNISFQIK